MGSPVQAQDQQHAAYESLPMTAAVDVTVVVPAAVATGAGQYALTQSMLCSLLTAV
jgi:hypothetical protein